MAIILIPCLGNNVEIRGKVKVVKRGLPTGPEAEQAAIKEALTAADRDAQNAMRSCRCRGGCGIAFKPPKIRIGASGS